MVIQGISYPSDFEAKKGMIDIGHRMEEKGCVIAGDGSLSVRVGPNAVWITAEGADKGALKQDSFLRVDLNGKQMPGSRQARLPEDVEVHLQIYQQNPSLRAVLHAYPVGAVALAARGQSVSPVDYTPSLRKLGKITLVPAGNAEAAAKAAVLACKTDSGVLLSGDGCMMWGESLTEAFHKLEALEYYARVSRMLCSGNAESSGYQAVGNTCGMSHVEIVPAGNGCETAGGSFSMEGLTPMIRPGEKLPILEERKQPVSEERKTSAAVPAASAGTGRNISAAAAAGNTAVVSDHSDLAVKRQQMMAEVVRRSLASL